MLNLATLLEDSARRAPEREAVIFDDFRLTYAAVDAAANQVANGLAGLGIQPGDKVAISCPNLPYFPIVYYGILKAGAVVVPLNILLKPREITYHLDDSDARVYFCFEGTEALPMGPWGVEGFGAAERCEHLLIMTANPAGPSPFPDVPTLGEWMQDCAATFVSVPTDPSDTAVILYTSGTTGQAKGAELTHSNMVLNARLCDNNYDRSTEDVYLITLPLFHSFGQTVLMNSGIYSRGTLVLLPRFDPAAVLGAMEKEGVTIFAGVPTMYWALLNHAGSDAFDLKRIASNLRVCVSGGAALPVEVMHAYEKKFDVPILEGYGLSETSPVATFNPIDRERKPGSIGLPVWGVEVRIVDEGDNDVPRGELGEIVIRGHNIMKGYYKRPEATAEAMRSGWFHSGDLGRMDEDGYIYITDRVKDLIIRGGFNVYPREVEEVLITHPAVSLAAVIGVPDDEYGEEVRAYVVLQQGTAVSEEELVAWSQENMASYKYPRNVEFREALPMNATGKILKRELRAQAVAGGASQPAGPMT
jgi:long-chain acyl-CoA synthetase